MSSGRGDEVIDEALIYFVENKGLVFLVGA
jgi:hypothetical protein